MLLYNFSDANERAIDDLPSMPVLMKPIKTAAALETERKYKEKLADEQARVNQGEAEAKGAKQGSWTVSEPGDLIEFD